MNLQTLNQKITKQFQGCGVYLIRIEHHLYVGSSKNIKNRFLDHRKLLKGNKHHSNLLQNSYNKYGIEKTYICILEFCSDGDRLIREKYWIDCLNPDCNTIKDPTDYANEPILNHPSLSKEIHQYSLEGNYIQTFASANEAGRSLNKTGASISQAARKSHSYNKSAYGYLWSYEKVEKMNYQNNSAKAKIKSINCFDIFTSKEYKFDSIADAVRVLHSNYSNFGAECAAISSIANRCKKENGGGYYLNRYIIKYTDQNNYYLGHTNAVFDVDNICSYTNKKEAVLQLNISIQELESMLSIKKFINIAEIARVKLRESGKLFKRQP